MRGKIQNCLVNSLTFFTVTELMKLEQIYFSAECLSLTGKDQKIKINALISKLARADI